MTLKETLLSINLVVDNEYLDKYCELIESNKETKRKKFKTQKHHIIPKYYYELNKLNVDNSKNNLVNLLYKDHLLAHYLLLKCSFNKTYKFQNSIVLYMALGKCDENNVDNLIKISQEAYKYYIENKPKMSEETKRKIGEANKISLKGHKLTESTKNKLSESTSRKVFYNNGVSNIFIDKDEIPPKDYIRGMLINHVDKDDWIRRVHAGRKSEDYNTTGGTIVINNGINNKHIESEKLNFYLEKGWKRGKLPLGKLNWYNNGIKNTRALSCPNGFVKGRLLTNNVRKSLGNGNRGKHVSEETKKKISNTIKNKKNLIG